jgi:hypothetical protein
MRDSDWLSGYECKENVGIAFPIGLLDAGVIGHPISPLAGAGSFVVRCRKGRRRRGRSRTAHGNTKRKDESAEDAKDESEETFGAGAGFTNRMVFWDRTQGSPRLRRLLESGGSLHIFLNEVKDEGSALTGQDRFTSCEEADVVRDAALYVSECPASIWRSPCIDSNRARTL